MREIRQLLDGVPVVLVTLDDWPGVTAPEETGSTFEENARAKALYWVEMTLQDDSVHNADADANNWWRAELLYSLA